MANKFLKTFVLKCLNEPNKQTEKTFRFAFFSRLMKYFAEWGVTAQGMYYIEGQIQDKDFRYTKTTFEYVVTFKTSGEGRTNK